MVRVPAGKFIMGTPAEQAATLTEQFDLPKGFFRAEMPSQTMTLDEFYIDQTTVTHAEYQKFLDAHPNRDVPRTSLVRRRGRSTGTRSRARSPRSAINSRSY